MGCAMIMIGGFLTFFGGVACVAPEEPTDEAKIILIVGALILIFGLINGFIKMCKNSEKELDLFSKLIDAVKEPYEEYRNKYTKVLEQYNNEYYYCSSENLQHYSIIDNEIHIMDFPDNEYAIRSDIEDNCKRISQEISQEELKIRIQNEIFARIPQEIPQIIYDINKIKYYKLEGSVRREQYITGGGGGGSSLTGAIVGGVIAGPAGAIVGSRKEINEVNTSYQEIDDRRLEITFEDEKIIKLPFGFYDKLLDYIPEKDYDNYIENKKIKGRKK